MGVRHGGDAVSRGRVTVASDENEVLIYLGNGYEDADFQWALCRAEKELGEPLSIDCWVGDDHGDYAVIPR